MSSNVASSPPLISVVLVSFHTGDALSRTIESVLQQDNAIELIIVNNGNPPAVVARLQAMQQADARIKIISGHGNVGFSCGNNLGVAASRGDYVLILNPDSELRHKTVVKLHHYAATLPSPFLLGARIVNEDGSDQRGCRRALLTPLTAFVEALRLSRLFPSMRLNLHEEPIPATIIPIPAISGAFMFLSRHAFDRIGGFDEGYFLHVEDLDFCFRFRQAGGEIYFAPDIVVTHIGGTSAASPDFVERHKTRGFSRYFHKNFKNSSPLALIWMLDLAIWLRYFAKKTKRATARNENESAQPFI